MFFYQKIQNLLDHFIKKLIKKNVKINNNLIKSSSKKLKQMIK